MLMHGVGGQLQPSTSSRPCNSLLSREGDYELRLLIIHHHQLRIVGLRGALRWKWLVLLFGVALCTG